MDLLEKAARALAERNVPGTIRGDDARSAWMDQQWQHYTPDVRCVLEAIRESSPALMQTFEATSPDEYTDPHPEDAWRAGINAILDGKRAIDRIAV